MPIRQETLPDGSVHFMSDGPVLLTGPGTGTVQLADGTVVDITPAVIEVASEEQALQIADAIAGTTQPKEN